ncbi:MAG: hypothetical protein SGILL_006967, partial [Bacillariaceae sp.]
KKKVYRDDAEAQIGKDDSIIPERSLPPTFCFTTTCQFLATAAVVLMGLGFTWHTFVSTTTSGCHHHSSSHPEMQMVMHQHQQEQPFLSESTAMDYRGVPHSMAEMDQVVSKTLIDFNMEDLTLPYDDIQDKGDADDEEEGQRLLDDQCMVDVKIDHVCEGCDEWIADSGLQDGLWCHTDLSEMTFTYTGCACGSWYTIDYENSAWANGTGHSEVVYECWEPDFNYNETNIPTEILCQDTTTLSNDGVEESLDSPSIEYFHADEVHWIAADAADPSNILGEGITTKGERYSISSGDPAVRLPNFVNVTFYLIDLEGDTVTLQTNVFPSAFCPGYADTWYRHGYANMHITSGLRTTGDLISKEDTLREDALWVKLVVDASESPVPVRLDEFNLISNIYPSLINLTDAVYDVELGGMETMEMSRTSGGRTSIHSTTHLRQSPTGTSDTMEVIVGPFTIDLYWRTRYTFFATIIASILEDNEALCNGFDFHEYIAGLG